jgi:metal-responsive CopG/Arc/MetJ family transcriptional regulator
MKVSLSLDPLLIRDVDAYVEEHEDADRSKVVDEALRMWSATQQRAAMELQFSDDGATNAAEQDAWRHLRREATSRRFKRA